MNVAMTTEGLDAKELLARPGKLIWLASYPKSGNTWFRIFLRNLLSPDLAPVSLDNIGFSIASARRLLDKMGGMKTSDLTPQELVFYRLRVFDVISAQTENQRFFKIHDAYKDQDGEPVVSARATRVGLYLVRNPLDLCASYANHMSCSIDEAINCMNDPEHGLSGRKKANSKRQLAQFMGTWSDHVRSWLDQDEFPVHVMRYEDMRADPLRIFMRAVQLSGLDSTDDDVRTALSHAEFSKLRESELEKGFPEKPRGTEHFFRKGQVSGWRDELSADQAAKLIEGHHDVMTRLGYLDAAGDPVF